MKYFEDFSPGECATVGSHHVTLEEIVQFARAWDPQPTHVDAGAAPDSQFRGLIASGAHLMAISVRLLVTSQEQPVAVVAGLGWDEVRFLAPVRPGDTVTLLRRCVEARPSRSKPDRGIVCNALQLINQDGAEVLAYRDTILVHRRPSGD